MIRMFQGAPVFNQDLTNWCVPKIRTEPIGFATGGSVLLASNKPKWGTCPFTGVCLPNNLNAAFNAKGCLECNNYAVGDEFDLNGNCYTVVNRSMLDSMVTNGGDFTRVCVSKVTNMSGLFDRAVYFNQDIGAWDVSNVTNMGTMFRFARSFNQDISDWDVSSAINMSKMFQSAFVFNQDIGNWDVSNVSSMAFMFLNAKAFNHDIGNWNVANVSSMIKMFKNTTVFNQDLTKWCVSLIPVRPLDFANGSTLLPSNEPGWGTCPPQVVVPGSFNNGTGSLGTQIPLWYVFQKEHLVYISLPKTNDRHRVEIYSTNGQQIASFSTDQNEVEILTDAPPGVYLIRFNGDTQRAVKQP
jgi:surface protein